jgi:hypothetical protein
MLQPGPIFAPRPFVSSFMGGPGRQSWDPLAETARQSADRKSRQSKGEPPSRPLAAGMGSKTRPLLSDSYRATRSRGSRHSRIRTICKALAQMGSRSFKAEISSLPVSLCSGRWYGCWVRGGRRISRCILGGHSEGVRGGPARPETRCKRLRHRIPWRSGLRRAVDQHRNIPRVRLGGG